jgi:hypothetical protein
VARSVCIAFVDLIQRVREHSMHSFSQIEVKVSGHVCADVTFASRDRLEDGSDVELWKGTAFRLSGLLR